MATTAEVLPLPPTIEGPDGLCRAVADGGGRGESAYAARRRGL